MTRWTWITLWARKSAANIFSHEVGGLSISPARQVCVFAPGAQCYSVELREKGGESKVQELYRQTSGVPWCLGNTVEIPSLIPIFSPDESITLHQFRPLSLVWTTFFLWIILSDSFFSCLAPGLSLENGLCFPQDIVEKGHTMRNVSQTGVKCHL